MREQEAQSKELPLRDIMANIIEISSKISPRAFALVKQLQKLLHLQIQGLLTVKHIKQQIKNPFPSPICSKQIDKSQCKTGFSCIDCRQSVGSILCYECFSQGNHKGHKVIEYKPTGTCDCGDVSAWSDKGFCKKHEQKGKIKVDAQLEIIFLAEIKFAMYLYFWFIEKTKNNPKIVRTSKVYTYLTFDILKQVIEQDFQLKYLLSSVMHSSLAEFQDITSKNLTIIQRFFVFEDSQPSNFIKVASRMFPVEEFRDTFTRLYFAKTFRNEMLLKHPISEISYLYLGRPKEIAQQILAGKIQPLLLDSSRFIQSSQMVISLFKRYLTDLYFLVRHKHAKEYFKVHFERVNICDMLFCREYTQISKSEEYEKEKIILDDYLLKFYGLTLKIIKDEKYLLQKIIKELITYIMKYERITTSILHQRAFSITVMVYLEGSLCNLEREQIRDFFLLLLNANNERPYININKVIEGLIEKFLKGISISSLFLEMHHNVNDDFHQQIQNLCLNRFLLKSLDGLYIKIMIRLLKEKLRLDSIIQKIIVKLHMGNQTKLIYHFLSMLSLIVSIQLDEMMVCDYLGIDCRQKIIHFLKRFIKTFPTLSAKEIKQSMKFIICNIGMVDQIFGNQIKINKGKIVADFDQVPFQILLYERFFNKAQIDTSKALTVYFKTLPKSVQFQNINLYNEVTASIAMRGLSSRIEASNNIQDLQPFLLEITKIYAYTKIECLDQMRDLIRQSMDALKIVVRPQVINQVTSIFYSEEQQEMVHLKQKQEELVVRKKENLIRKRKEKEEIMKKNQQQLLKNYQDTQRSSNIDVCIYCKQVNSDKLYLIAYCNLTNIYQLRCLKIDDRHLFLQTCGHFIHFQCYQQQLQKKKQMNRCFLCKMDMNILIPQINKDLDKQKLVNLRQEFVEMIYPILLNTYPDNQQILQQFYTVKHQNNIMSVLIESLIREVILRMLYDFQSFQKELFPIYSFIFNIVKSSNAQVVRKALNHFEKVMSNHKSQEYFKDLQKRAIQLLVYQIYGNESNKGQVIHNYCTEETMLYNIFECFNNRQFRSIQLKEISIIQKYPIINPLHTKFIQLPEEVQCQQCSRVTHRLYSCLLCDWKSCEYKECFMKGKAHAANDHLEGIVLMFRVDGSIIYDYGGNVKIAESVYVNFLGEALLATKMILNREDLQKFELNVDYYESIKKKVIRHMVHNCVDK